jgi:hypothetical protein
MATLILPFSLLTLQAGGPKKDCNKITTSFKMMSEGMKVK